MAVQVTLMPPARRKLQNELVDQVCHEVELVFPEAEAVSIYDVLQGFHSDQRNKLILAVEVQSRVAQSDHATYETHVVKLGDRAEVAPDVEGWRQCTAGRPMSRRIFVPVRLQELANQTNRAAVIYRDAAQWYGLLTPQNEVATLAWAIDKAVFSPHEINFSTVERIIRQVLSELGRSFYHTAEENPHAAEAFYRAKLRLDQPQPVVHKWKEGECWSLRRDVDWLLSGGISPASNTQPEYVDPYDFVLGLLDRDGVPPTLVGPTHGDLHANNIIVGVAGDEVEYPLLIDYGDMAVDNVVAWDFVKLELELKVRLLTKLFGDPATRESLWNDLRGERFQQLAQRWKQQQHIATNPLIDRTQQIAFAFEFERQLAEQTDQIDRTPRRPGASIASATPAFGRAVTLMQTIRSQAAEQLGRTQQRSSHWRKELDACLAIYGLNTVKFSDDAYPIYQRLFALVSAGMAAARLMPAIGQSGETNETSGPQPLCYHIPLRQAYRKWKANDQLEQAEQLLLSVSSQFDYGVPFVRERALIQAKLGRTDEASQLLEAIAHSKSTPSPSSSHTSLDIATLCVPFLEIEVLARLGRIYKDKADAAWEKLGVEFVDLHDQPPVQFYRSAHVIYGKAFEISLDYYPGGNAAVTGLLCGANEAATDIARRVSLTCKSIDLASLSRIDRYWVLATEGEMALLLGNPQEAASFFTTAFDELPSGNDGMIQASYAQLCRLYRALGADSLQPVLRVFRDIEKFQLEPGQLGDCGGLFSSNSLEPPP